MNLENIDKEQRVNAIKNIFLSALCLFISFDVNSCRADNVDESTTDILKALFLNVRFLNMSYINKLTQYST